MCAKSDYGKPASEGYSKEYAKAWLRSYGDQCPECRGSGKIPLFNAEQGGITVDDCDNCNGMGYLEKKKIKRRKK